MSKFHSRGSSADDFRVIKNNIQKENQDQNAINEKLQIMEKQLQQNESYNDQYLLTNSIENSALKLRTQNGSISFHFQSYEPNKSKKNSFYEEPPRKEEPNKQQFSSTNNNDSALIMLLNEFEKRFQIIEERLEHSERTNRQLNSNGKMSSEFVTQLQDRLMQILQKINKFEHKVKNLEDSFIQHKNNTEKRIIEYNNHVDQSLRQFIDSSLKIQKKIDKLTTGSGSNQDIEFLKQKTDNLTLNLAKTHDLLTQQMMEFSSLQQQINQLSKQEFITSICNEISEIKEGYQETMHYLRELQDYLVQ